MALGCSCDGRLLCLLYATLCHFGLGVPSTTPWSHIPCIAVLSDTSNRPQHHIGNSSGMHIYVYTYTEIVHLMLQADKTTLEAGCGVLGGNEHRSRLDPYLSFYLTIDLLSFFLSFCLSIFLSSHLSKEPTTLSIYPCTYIYTCV